jgi:hypothetical protein
VANAPMIFIVSPGSAGYALRGSSYVFGRL